MEWTALITLESNTQAPRTERFSIEANQPQAAASKAIRLMRKAHKGARWTSLALALEKSTSQSEE